jgi:hypothetical protein
MDQIKPPGYDLLNSKQQAMYDADVSAGKNESLPKEKRQLHRNNAAVKLKRVTEKRMSATDLAKLKSDKQAVLEHREQQILYRVSLLRGKQKLAYDGWIAEAKHPATTKARKNICNGRAVQMADYAVNRHIEKAKKVIMTPEELQAYMESDEAVAKRKESKIKNDKYRQKEKELRDSGDQLALNRRKTNNENQVAKNQVKRAEASAEIAHRQECKRKADEISMEEDGSGGGEE